MIYHAEIYQKLLQTETGLYAQSPSYIYELLEEERKAKKQLPLFEKGIDACENDFEHNPHSGEITRGNPHRMQSD